MSLPSQQRSFGGRVGRKKAGGSARLIVIGVAALTVVGIGWLLTRGGDEPAVRTDSQAAALSEQAGAALSETRLSETGLSETGLLDHGGSESDDVMLIEDDGFVETGVLSARQEDSRPRAGENAPMSTALAALRERDAAADRAANPAAKSPAAEPAAAPATPRPEFGGDLASLMNAARDHLRNQNLVEARTVLNEALRHPSASAAQQAVIRSDIATLNEDLFFGRLVYPGDPIASEYTVQPGDSLARITYRKGLACDWRLLRRINGLDQRGSIRVGQTLKLVQGPFHAMVDKSDYRLDLYAGPPGAESQWVYIRSFEVGLGAADSTPVGTFVVKQDSKLINPNWRNPRTGEFFAADDPANPIGEYWIGIEGVGEAAVHTGYGLHGTIDPESIGSQASMGCVRMQDEDIAMVYDLMSFTVSEVHVRP
ncbi:MAG: L,D-transpeptidase family protein [Planctomycetota bacterium]